MSNCVGVFVHKPLSVMGAGVAAVLLLSGCALTERVGGGEASSPTPTESVPLAATPAPTVFPLAEGVSGDALACQDANAASDAMFALTQGGGAFGDDAPAQTQFSEAVDQLLAARDSSPVDPEVQRALSDLVLGFTGRTADRDDWLMWDAAKAHAQDPGSGPLSAVLVDAADACDDVDYTWVDWQPVA